MGNKYIGNAYNRRKFLATSVKGAAGAIALSHIPTIVPASVIGKNPPSSRINVGVIGVGRIARHWDIPGIWKYDIAKVMAVCDLDRKRIQKGKEYVDEHYAKKTGKSYNGTKTYEDYEDLLANKDIDAVLICTPDHWHALAAIHAARAGKHIYLEKPASLKASGDKPIKEGYEKIIKSRYAKLDDKADSYQTVIVKGGGTTEMENHFRGDAIAAYANALQWVITGKDQYKKKSIKILTLWGKTAKRIVEPKYKTQPALEASWALPIWVSAAEIIRYYNNRSANWLDTDVKKFDGFVLMLLQTISGSFSKVPNWKASRALARMSAGVFLEDQDVYDLGYQETVVQIGNIGADGEPSENHRDFGHCQYNIIATAQCAEIAFNQGDNSLYLMKLPGESSDEEPLLLRQSEYFSNEILGNVPEGGVDYSNYQTRRHDPPYEMVLNRFQNNFGISLPVTYTYVMQYNRPTDVHETHFVGWTTLIYAK